jgi:hypothetical protein
MRYAWEQAGRGERVTVDELCRRFGERTECVLILPAVCQKVRVRIHDLRAALDWQHTGLRGSWQALLRLVPPSPDGTPTIVLEEEEAGGTGVDTLRQG